jgi:hypothetical protein
MIRLAAAFALLATAAPAAAQWVAVGRWGTEGNFRYVAPGTWMVLQRDGGVEVTAEGDNHQGRIEMLCGTDLPEGQMRFSGYFGDALEESVMAPAGAGQQPVSLVVDGQSFERMFHYRAEARDWVAEDALDASLLDAFAWGSRFEILNAAGERVTAYSLNGSGAARSALRRACGI